MPQLNENPSRIYAKGDMACLEWDDVDLAAGNQDTLDIPCHDGPDQVGLVWADGSAMSGTPGTCRLRIVGKALDGQTGLGSHYVQIPGSTTLTVDVNTRYGIDPLTVLNGRFWRETDYSYPLGAGSLSFVRFNHLAGSLTQYDWAWFTIWMRYKDPRVAVKVAGQLRQQILG